MGSGSNGSVVDNEGSGDSVEGGSGVGNESGRVSNSELPLSVPPTLQTALLSTCIVPSDISVHVVYIITVAYCKLLIPIY